MWQEFFRDPRVETPRDVRPPEAAKSPLRHVRPGLFGEARLETSLCRRSRVGRRSRKTKSEKRGGVGRSLITLLTLVGHH